MDESQHPAMTDPAFEREWTVRFADADPFEIAYYPRILQAMHGTADEYLESIGWPLWTMIDDGIGLPVVDVGAQFHRPSRMGDTVTIGLTADLGDTSVRFEYAGSRDGEALFTGYEQRVCAEVGGGQSVSLPDGLREALTPE
jgi:4-hydroxybenzoyl-CoA thioesterase